ncbi:glycosyltransferase 87 family protein [Kribbella deserti]|uniref:Glycosyltransferase 87 family protein n=1 Tax=Kribbella deserti TaxID=1926257 RepID=A0ABV6QPQ3_9ACTN
MTGGTIRPALILVGALGAVALGSWQFGFLNSQIDLRVYRMGGSVLLDGGSLYDAQLAGSGLPFTYPPFSAVMMLPLAVVPLWLAVIAWTTLSVLCLAWIWRTTLATVDLPERFRPTLLVITVLTVLSLPLEPVWQTVQFGQINLLLTAMILVDLMRPANARGRGFWVGVAIGIKLTPLPFLAFLLVTKQWKALRNALAGLIATMAIGFAVVPKQSWSYWTEIMPNAERVGGLAYTANQSVMGFLTRVLGDSSAVRPLWFVLSCIIALTAIWLSRQLWVKGERLGAISVCAFAVLYASPVSWSHHWVWIIPLGISLIRASYDLWGRRPAQVGLRANAKPILIGVAWFGLFAWGPIWHVPYRDDRELEWNFGQALLGNSYLLAGLAAMAYLTVVSRALAPQPAAGAELSEPAPNTAPR